MTEAQMADYQKLGIALAILYVGYKYAPKPAFKAMVLGAAGIVVAKRVPYVREVI